MPAIDSDVFPQVSEYVSNYVFSTISPLARTFILADDPSK
jgi:hypothetical protein